MTLALILSIIKYKHEHKISLDEAIEELRFSTSVIETPGLETASWKCSILSVESIGTSFDSATLDQTTCTILLDELADSCLFYCRSTPRKLRIMLPICEFIVKNYHHLWQLTIQKLFAGLDNIFRYNNVDDPINQIRLTYWYITFINNLLDKFVANDAEHFMKLLIHELIEKMYNLVIRYHHYDTQQHTALSNYSQILQNLKIHEIHHDISCHKIAMLLLLYINIILYVQDQDQFSYNHHCQVLVVLLMTDNKDLIHYYQSSTCFNISSR